jgi:hypothetical protein
MCTFSAACIPHAGCMPFSATNVERHLSRATCRMHAGLMPFRHFSEDRVHVILWRWRCSHYGDMHPACQIMPDACHHIMNRVLQCTIFAQVYPIRVVAASCSAASSLFQAGKPLLRPTARHHALPAWPTIIACILHVDRHLCRLTFAPVV